jgi:hypothetical protein
MLAAAADALEIPVCQTSAEALSIDACDLRRRAGADAALHFIAGPDGPERAHGADVIDAALTLKRIGMAGIAFCDDGKVRPASLDRIKKVLAALDAS